MKLGPAKGRQAVATFTDQHYFVFKNCRGRNEKQNAITASKTKKKKHPMKTLKGGNNETKYQRKKKF
jgi:hypothetical protein